jgi:hypothetical protein
VIRGLVAVLLAGIVAGTFAGCELFCKTRVPADGQVVRISATATELRLDPSSVRAGDVYLELDPAEHGVSFISELPPDFQTGGRDLLPLSDEDIASIRQIGSAEGTAENAFSIGGCGNVFKVTVFPGNYALVIDRNVGAGPPAPALLLVAVLQVLP